MISYPLSNDVNQKIETPASPSNIHYTGLPIKNKTAKTTENS